IVIDTSGSMGGESILQARRAVDFALGTLRPEDAFNVIRFDSDFRAFFDGARPATARAIEEARRWVDGLQANGGTNMLPALEAALTPGRESRAVRQVIFVTDGALGNEAALFEALHEDLGRSRLYTVGIGSAPNSHFMSKAAEIGRGTFTFIARPSEVAQKMAALFRKLESPVLHDLTVEWGETGVEAWPARIPDIYLTDPVVVTARLPKGGDQIVLRGRRGVEDVTIALPLEGGSNHAGISRLWARRKIAALMDSLSAGGEIDRVSVEVAALGVRHQLVTRWSSLVAVDVTPTAPVGVVPETRAVPPLRPRGWDFLKLFGGAPPRGATGDGPDAARDRGPNLTGGGVGKATQRSSISQPVARVLIGRLPQGGTPAALFVSIGSLLLGGAALTWPFARRGASDLRSKVGPTQRDRR
ncbi:MAG: VWA domain-containing protein, partial [bacterium]|nr:VWA domain-containing protein [bacterium]